jgi:hypothetical protein
MYIFFMYKIGPRTFPIELDRGLDGSKSFSQKEKKKFSSFSSFLRKKIYNSFPQKIVSAIHL